MRGNKNCEQMGTVNCIAEKGTLVESLTHGGRGRCPGFPRIPFFRRPLGIQSLLSTRQEPLDAAVQIIGPILVRTVRNGLERLDQLLLFLAR